MSNQMLIAVTGHRPEKLGGYGKAVFDKLTHFARIELGQLSEHAPNGFIIRTGMAQGWDQAVAQACIDLSIPFIACVPCDEQERLWPPAAKAYYAKLLSRADSIVCRPGGEYAAWKMQKRNEFMVDNSKLLLGLWDGSAGGTANCIRYAIRVGCSFINCWNRWTTFA